jgi:pimeloyl-ACP methyl ester carboxylesterase
MAAQCWLGVMMRSLIVCGLFAGAVLAGQQVPADDASTRAAAPAASAAPSSPADFAGPWTGVMRVGGQTLTFRVVFAPSAAPVAPTTVGNPAWTATLGIREQGVADFALSDVVAGPDRVAWRMAGVPGAPSYQGVRDRDQIRGTFSQGGATFELNFARGDESPKRVPRSQEPAEPITAYRAEEVTITAPAARLAGTLTLPPGPGPHPAVLLISGSGPQDRNSEIFNHRPFLIWADRLTRAGVAVLRVDDRGVGASVGSMATATTADLTQDARASVEFLLTRADVSRVAVVGHSEGAIIAAALGAGSERIAGVVMLAGPGLTGRGTLVAQNRALALSSGRSAAEAEAIAVAADALFAATLAERNEATLIDLARTLVSTQTGLTREDAAVGREAASTVLTLRSPWMTYFMSVDPAENLARLTAPVLAIFGGRDAQVVADAERPPMEAALSRAPTRDVTIRVYAGLNHLLQPSATGAMTEYEQIPITVDEAVLAEVRDWLVQRLMPAAEKSP